MLELRRDFGLGMITALARIEGRPVGVIANNPTHLAGAIDSPGADKAARFMQLCDAFDLPIITLCDTPGMMVGPDVEATALVRHCSRLFVTGANVTVPLVTIVLRKAYGLGAQAMMGGTTKAPLACLAWPTGEFGGMGLEGAVRLGYPKELAAVEDPDEREALFQQLVERMYEIGKALSVASLFEIDDVIDPADTRRWLTAVLDAAGDPAAAHRQEAPERRHLVTRAARCVSPPRQCSVDGVLPVIDTTPCADATFTNGYRLDGVEGRATAGAARSLGCRRRRRLGASAPCSRRHRLAELPPSTCAGLCHVARQPPCVRAAGRASTRSGPRHDRLVLARAGRRRPGPGRGGVAALRRRRGPRRRGCALRAPAVAGRDAAPL